MPQIRAPPAVHDHTSAAVRDHTIYIAHRRPCAITQARPQRRAAAPAPVSRRRGRWLSGRSRWWAGPPPAPVSPVPSPWERPASSLPPLHTFESREDVRTSEPNQLLVLASSAHRRATTAARVSCSYATTRAWRACLLRRGRWPGSEPTCLHAQHSTATG